MSSGSRIGKELSPRSHRGRRVRCLLTTLVLVSIGEAQGGGIAADERLPALVRAEALHAEGITGRGVTIAVVDGIAALGPEILQAGDGHRRLLAAYDAVSDRPEAAPPGQGQRPESAGAEHLLDAMVSSRRDGDGRYEGIAPNADLVLVRAIGVDGAGRPGDVIRAIGWVIANRDRYGIRVLNLPLVAPARPRFWEDPLNQAVIQAWRAGIVVVVAAGNDGPVPATIAAPGNVPHVITVGAVAAGAGQGLVHSYSAAGPTLDGFVKPEIVAPAGAVEPAPAPAAAGTIRRPRAGTSVSSAIVSGVVALILEASPWLTPDEVKHRLLESARPAVPPSGEEYPILRQGAGLVNALDAVGSSTIAGADHQPGDEYHLSGFTWSDRAARGITWSDFTAKGLTWSDFSAKGLAWSDRRASRGLTWSD